MCNTIMHYMGTIAPSMMLSLAETLSSFAESHFCSPSVMVVLQNYQPLLSSPRACQCPSLPAAGDSMLSVCCIAAGNPNSSREYKKGCHTGTGTSAMLSITCP
jgi:hypothetical protein